MQILAFVLLIAGGVVGYGAKFFLEKFSRKEFGDKEIGILKTIGLLTALAGAILIFIIK